MAKIIENMTGRRMVQISTDDIISIVREYQNLTHGTKEYEQVRKILSKNKLFLPEDI